jgi:hypothetical protein
MISEQFYNHFQIPVEYHYEKSVIELMRVREMNI